MKRILSKNVQEKSAQQMPVDQSMADSQETQFAVDQAYDRGEGKKTLGYWMRDPEFAKLYNSARLGDEQAKGQLQAYCKMNGVDTTSPELLEIFANNKRKVVIAADWNTVQNNNEGINSARRRLKNYATFLEGQGGEFQPDFGEDAELIPGILADIKAVDDVLSQAYLDSGYQYDDQDPRNMHEHLDNYFDDEKARTGSDLKEQMESQIRQQVAMQEVDNIEQRITQLDKGGAFRDYIEEINYQEAIAREERDMYGDADYY